MEEDSKCIYKEFTENENFKKNIVLYIWVS